MIADHIKNGIFLGAIVCGVGSSILLLLAFIIDSAEKKLGKEGAIILTIIVGMWIVGFAIGAFKP